MDREPRESREEAHELALGSAAVRDLAALLALPRMWRDREPDFIAQSLADVLTSLMRSDVACVRVDPGKDAAPLEAACPRHVPWHAMRALSEVETPAGIDQVALMPNPIGTGTMRVLRVTSQLSDQRAVVVIGSERVDFPTTMDSFFCRVAVEQAMIALHSTQLVTRLKAANQAKSQFLATMSHELRTPLNAIIGYGELLQHGIGGELGTLQSEYVGRVESAARHLLGLIEGILTFARVDAGKEEVHLGDVDPVQLAESAMALVEPLVRSKGLELRLTVVDAPPRLCSDAAKLRQVVLNLLSNAVKFTPKGEIAVEVRGEGDAVLWTVADTGIGIAPDALDRIFEPFQQLGPGRAGRAPGTGLGLSVARQLARLLGGDVSVESVPGSGSRFTVRVPVDGASATGS